MTTSKKFWPWIDGKTLHPTSCTEDSYETCTELCTSYLKTLEVNSSKWTEEKDLKLMTKCLSHFHFSVTKYLARTTWRKKGLLWPWSQWMVGWQKSITEGSCWHHRGWEAEGKGRSWGKNPPLQATPPTTTASQAPPPNSTISAERTMGESTEYSHLQHTDDLRGTFQIQTIRKCTAFSH